MASRKSERLINLTMALLATKRYLTKSEILRTVEGYLGSDESKERMFERDKDDLRRIGIEIEVRSLDALFEDELGYRIRSESYSLNLGELSGEEIALLSLATEAWRGAALAEPAQSALVKLSSLGIASDFDSLPALSPRVTVDSVNFVPITQAIDGRRRLSFVYLSSLLIEEEREIEPYGLGSRAGVWYLVGEDLARKAMRTFRLDRIVGEVVIASPKGSFVIDKTFNVLKYLDSQLFDEETVALVYVRLGKGFGLRTRAKVVSTDDEFDLCEIPFRNVERFIDQILWHGEDVVVKAPEDLRAQVVERLEELVRIHG